MKRTNNRITVNSWLKSLGFASHSCIRPQPATSDWCTGSFAFALYRWHPHPIRSPLWAPDPIQCKYYEACPQLAMSVSSYVLAWAHRYCSLTRIQLGAEGKPPSSDMFRFPNGPASAALLSSPETSSCESPRFTVLGASFFFAGSLEKNPAICCPVRTSSGWDRQAPNSSLAEWRFELHARR